MSIGLKIEKQILKRKNGITLIALVITIIVLLILAGVSINAVFSDNGIIKKAQEAQNKMNEAVQNDMEGINYLNDVLNNYVNGTGSTTDSDEESDGEKISTEKSYVGYYADVDGDGTVDGVIFADLLIGGSGTWNPAENTEEWAITGGTYTIDKISSSKNYTISQESYEGKFGTQPVLQATSKSGNNRFYVMALSNLDSSSHCWYQTSYSYGMSDYADTTSIKFGTGKANTETMIEKWNDTAYGSQNGNLTHPDVWGIVQEKYEEGWFVPSANEWAAFGSAFIITTDNYSGTYGLSSYYWSSSQNSSTYVYNVHFDGGYVDITKTSHYIYVRLSTTF